jgi:hypothetical protein
MSNTAEDYLRDSGALLKERAKAAYAEATAAKGTAESALTVGRSMAYYEVISLMQQQAVAFQLPFEALSLADIDPDRDLL